MQSELLPENASMRIELGKTWPAGPTGETRERVLWEHTVTEYINENPPMWRDEAKPLLSLDNGGAEVMARVSSSYLIETIYHCFFSRCLANVRGTRTASPSCRPWSVTVAIDRPASLALIWLCWRTPRNFHEFLGIRVWTGTIVESFEKPVSVVLCNNSEIVNKAYRQFVLVKIEI